MSHQYRLLIPMIACMFTACSGENLKGLSSSEIELLLKGNTVEGIRVKQQRPFKQYFGANNITVMSDDGKRTGKWRVEDDSYCIIWLTARPVNNISKKTENSQKGVGTDLEPKERCWSLKQDKQGSYRALNINNDHIFTFVKVLNGNPEKL